MPGYTLSAAREQLRLAAAPRGRGWAQLLKFANPAAGGGFTHVIPGEYWYRPLAVTFTLTTDATAQNRQVAIAYTDGDGFAFASNPAVTQAFASQAITVVADQQINASPAGPQSLNAYGTATSPGAAGNIASLAGVQPGVYLIGWQVELSGTLASPADNDNFAITFSGRTVARSVNSAIAGTYLQQQATLVVPAAGTVNLQTVGAATVGAVYAGSLTLTAVQTMPLQAMIPDMVLKSGWQIQLQAVNFHAGDQLSGIGILAERYPSGDIDKMLGDAAGDLAAVLLTALQG